MVSEHEFTSLVEAIYAAGADFGRWDDTLRRIAQAYHARTVVLAAYSERPEDCYSIAPDIDQSVQDRYAAYYHWINPIWRRTIDMAPGEVRTDTMIVPRQKFVATEFFHDFLRPQEIGSMLGVTAHNDDGRLCVISVQRERPFDEEDVALYQRLGTHMHRAVQLNLTLAKLDMTSRAATDALDRLSQGVLLLDHASRVLFANGVAQRLFEGDGGLRLVEGVLHTRGPVETSKLHGLVAGCGKRACEAGSGGSLAVSRGATRPRITLSVTPFRGAEPTFPFAARPVAIVLIEDPERHAQPTAERVKHRFGLTPKETALAMEVLRGGSVQACSDRLGISRATAQTHLAHIFQKTGARRQSELVRLLMEPIGENSFS